ncbi:MAG: immunity 53 family protein [Planctomycetaceae bacterium]|nr:immunity 53 family protein [Planctomycetaceae bacterium]
MNTLLRLEEWYAAQCDGNWEHQYGVHIGTLDNPGWLVRVDLVGTSLEGQTFIEVSEGVGIDCHPVQSRWIHCAVRDGAWRGAGDEQQLLRILKLFLEWSSNHV